MLFQSVIEPGGVVFSCVLGSKGLGLVAYLRLTVLTYVQLSLFNRINRRFIKRPWCQTPPIQIVRIQIRVYPSNVPIYSPAMLRLVLTLKVTIKFLQIFFHLVTIQIKVECHINKRCKEVPIPVNDSITYYDAFKIKLSILIVSLIVVFIDIVSKIGHINSSI